MSTPSSSSRLYFCRWDFCTRAFPSVPALAEHFSLDHVPAEQPQYVPAHKRRRRDDGAWIIVEESFRIQDALPHPQLSQTTGGNTTTTTSTSGLGLPGSFDYPSSLVPSPVAIGAGVGLGDPRALANPLDIGVGGAPVEAPFADVDQAQLDYDAFLRSPSPNTSPRAPFHPFQSTPLSQVPPGSQPMGIAPAIASGSALARATGSDSSGARVSPATSAAAPTQLPLSFSSASQLSRNTPAKQLNTNTGILAPDTSHTSSDSGAAGDTSAAPSTQPQGTPSSGKGTPARIPSIGFGAAAPGESPASRRRSDVGFTWGLQK